MSADKQREAGLLRSLLGSPEWSELLLPAIAERFEREAANLMRTDGKNTEPADVTRGRLAVLRWLLGFPEVLRTLEEPPTANTEPSDDSQPVVTGDPYNRPDGLPNGQE